MLKQNDTSPRSIYLMLLPNASHKTTNILLISHSNHFLFFVNIIFSISTLFKCFHPHVWPFHGFINHFHFLGTGQLPSDRQTWQHIELLFAAKNAEINQIGIACVINIVEVNIAMSMNITLRRCCLCH